jgi:hypothetical protein
MNALKLDFCRKVAAFDECRGYESFGSPTTIAWMSSVFQMTENDAAGCIALGRYLAALDERRARETQRKSGSARSLTV